MIFAELTPGTLIESPDRPAGAEEIIAFASRYDAQWFHVDQERATTRGWKGLIGSGWLTCAIAMAQAIESILGASESFGSPGLDQVRWALTGATGRCAAAARRGSRGHALCVRADRDRSQAVATEQSTPCASAGDDGNQLV